MKQRQPQSLTRRRLLAAGGIGVGLAGIGSLNGASFAQLFQSDDLAVPDRVKHLYRPQELLGAPHQLFAAVDVATLRPHLSKLPDRHATSIRNLAVAGTTLGEIASISGVATTYFTQTEGAGAAHMTGEFDATRLEDELRSLDAVQQAGTVDQYSLYRASTDRVAAELAVSNTELILGGTVGADVDPTQAIQLMSDAAAGDATRYYADSAVGRAMIDSVVDYPAIGGLESGRLAPLSEVGVKETVQQAVFENLQGVGIGSQPVDRRLSMKAVLKYRSDSPPVSAVEDLLTQAQESYPSLAAGVSVQSVHADGSLVVVETESDPSEVSLPQDLDEDALSRLLLQAPALSRDSRVWREIQQYLALFQEA